MPHTRNKFSLIIPNRSLSIPIFTSLTNTKQFSFHKLVPTRRFLRNEGAMQFIHHDDDDDDDDDDNDDVAKTYEENRTRENISAVPTTHRISHCRIP